MSLFNDLLKGKGAGKLKESLNELTEAVKKIDTTELGEAVKGLAEALPKEFTDSIKNQAAGDSGETYQQSAASDVSDASPVSSVPTNLSYATANYDGIRRDDYYLVLPEDEMDCKGKILEVLAADFPQYEVREEVSPATIGGTGRFMNYSLGLYENDVPKLFIMLIGQATTRYREYRWAKEVAAKAGVEMINFIEHAPNRYWYIAERLRNYL